MLEVNVLTRIRLQNGVGGGGDRQTQSDCDRNLRTMFQREFYDSSVLLTALGHVRVKERES